MEENELEQLNGTVESVTFRREDSGFTVLELEADGELVTAVGVLPQITEGEELELAGRWDSHPSFGRQFRVEFCQQHLPESASAILRYLSSGVIKGIGPVMAEKLVSEFGEATFEVLENEPERLASIKGISEKMARKFCNEFKKQFEIRQVLLTLTTLGLTSEEALNAYRIWGNETIPIVTKNPYAMCISDVGLSFERADEIAGNVPQQPEWSHRAGAGVLYVLRHNLGIGHTCLPRHLMIRPCRDLLECAEDDVEIIIDALIEEKQILTASIQGKDFLFLPTYYHAEKDIAERFGIMNRFPPANSEIFKGEIFSFEQVNGLTLEERQREAVETAVKKGLLILTGGPGTGKTTTVKGIISLMKQRGLEVALAAPTGRAAKRMSELTGYEAKTIHRLLEVEFKEHGQPEFQHDEQNPLDIDAVVVDELSMVDVLLFDALLRALPLGCRLIMVGDSDQLPPVGAGNVLQDLIRSGTVPVIRLERVFRQEKESRIIENAHAIVKGVVPDLTVREADSDFFFMQENNPVIATKKVVQLCTERLVKAYGFSVLEEIQVLCPSRMGELGTMNLNQMLQNVLNPKQKEKKELRYKGYVLREGDKVMQVKNNYDIPWTSDTDTGTGVFNGDIGILTYIDLPNGLIGVKYEDRDAVYSTENAGELELAYAMTVHKSQGSEFKAVVMPLLGVPAPLCYRNLLYTAVTRAKSLMVVLGNPAILQRMVENDKKTRRYSALYYFLKKSS